MSYSPIDPATWSRTAASAFIIGLDVGMHADHCALVLAGVWPLAPPTIGIVAVKQFPLGTPLEEVADEVAQAVRENRSKAVVDSTNNSAFVGMLAARLPQPSHLSQSKRSSGRRRWARCSARVDLHRSGTSAANE